ncbi:MAG: hypothetical protein QXV82_09000 [Ignisphaera sp.]
MAGGSSGATFYEVPDKPPQKVHSYREVHRCKNRHPDDRLQSYNQFICKRKVHEVFLFVLHQISLCKGKEDDGYEGGVYISMISLDSPIIIVVLLVIFIVSIVMVQVYERERD